MADKKGKKRTKRMWAVLYFWAERGVWLASLAVCHDKSEARARQREILAIGHSPVVIVPVEVPDAKR